MRVFPEISRAILVARALQFGPSTPRKDEWKMQGPGDPRYGYQRNPYAAAPAQHPQAQYGRPAQQAYSQPPQQPQYAQPQYAQQVAPAPAPVASTGWGGLAAGVGGLNVGVPGMNMMSGALAKAPSGLPAPMAFGMAIAAVLVALVFDVIFLKVHIPGIGGYAWYLTTALSFAGAGFGAAKLTKASKKVALTAIACAGVIYGFADLGLSLVLEDVTMGGALFLGVQGLVIALVTGGGGVHRGARAKAIAEGEG
jgi:hypothetical protein